MALFTTTEDKQLEAARAQVVAGDAVCPGCKVAFTITGATLTMFNAALGMEGHRCPNCGYRIVRRRPSPDGL